MTAPLTEEQIAELRGLSVHDSSCCSLSEYRPFPCDCGVPKLINALCDMALRYATATKDRDWAIDLLRAWAAGCGDEHFSTKEQCRTLINASGEFFKKYPLDAAPPKAKP